MSEVASTTRPVLHLKTNAKPTEPAPKAEPPKAPQPQQPPKAKGHDPLPQDRLEKAFVAKSLNERKIALFTFADGSTCEGRIIASARFTIELESGELLFKHALRSMRL